MCIVFQHRISDLILPLILAAILTISLAPLLSASSSPKPSTSLPLAAVNGPQTTLTILVQFPNKPNSTRPSQIATLQQSVNNYYAEDSYGAISFVYTITPSTASWYVMPNTMEYYGADTPSSNSQLVHDSLQAAYNAGVNLANYKYALVVHAGDDSALPPHNAGDIHSYTIQGYSFRVGLTTYTMSTSVVAESDPMGVYAHESGHLLGLPDLYDVTQQIDPANNFVEYWDLMALGEWNPNNGLPSPSPGTFPAHMSAWSKIELGFLPQTGIVTVNSGNSTDVTVRDLELPTSGVQAVKIPVAYDAQGRLTYYLVELRAKVGTYDQYLPFPPTYPNAGLLIYKVNETIQAGHGSVKLIDAHPGGDLNDAPFGPCSAPCVSNNIFSDPSNYVKVIITTTSPTGYSITIDRTNSPQLLLQVNTPGAGVLVSVDGINQTTDSSNELRITVRYGPHTIFVQPQIPVSVGSTTVQIGLTNTFSSWSDGGNSNPRGLSVVQDTVITALYRITVEPSLPTAITALIILAVVITAVTLHRRRRPALQQMPTQPAQAETSNLNPLASSQGLLPRNDSLPGGSIGQHQKPESS